MPSKVREKISSPAADRGYTPDEIGQAARASTVPQSAKSNKAGSYIRWTVAVRGDQHERIDKLLDMIVAEVYEETGVVPKFNKQHLGRWMIDVALEQIANGARPPFEKRQRVEIREGRV